MGSKQGISSGIWKRSEILIHTLAKTRIIFVWLLEISVASRRITDPFIAGVDTLLEASISTILICRFMLDLRRFNDEQKGMRSNDGLGTISSFKAQFKGMHGTFIEEFGSSRLQEWIDPRDQAVPSSSVDESEPNVIETEWDMEALHE
ncbi:hypothetical protein M422DRAFT_44675 [Sphaerobolus stellatus SS14]|nr:hypothetical protein M422DRAFT_44675 [Sphaerobolus stellatus SS14]